jgi:hypothetical protein
MIIATLLRQIDFPGTDNICLFRFSAPSVPAATISDEIKFVIHRLAKFENIRVVCSSKNYSLSVRLTAGVTPPTIEEIYSVIGISQSYYDDHIDIWYGKPEGVDQNNLYGVIKNVDNVNATGTLFFEFVLTCF